MSFMQLHFFNFRPVNFSFNYWPLQWPVNFKSSPELAKITHLVGVKKLPQNVMKFLWY